MTYRPRERALFRKMLRERREYPLNSPDWIYRTKAARTYLEMIRSVPVHWGPQ